MTDQPVPSAPSRLSSERITRLWMGALLILLTIAVLAFDVNPWYPCLVLYLHFLGLIATLEVHNLLAHLTRPPRWLSVLSVQVVLFANWPSHWGTPWPSDTWLTLQGTFVAVVLAAFLFEMARFREPGESAMRIAISVWIVSYLGVLPSFLAQQRWLGAHPHRDGAVFLAMTIFVAKGCDIGAYFTGQLLGKHRMSPVLSPKKTWEGLAGGVVLSVAIAVGIQWGFPVLRNQLIAVGFGITVGLAGVLGDLAESLLKRDGQQKDASHIVPGFGGVLDVIDSLLFAAPVACLWISL